MYFFAYSSVQHILCCVLFLFCFSSSGVPYVTGFSKIILILDLRSQTSSSCIFFNCSINQNITLITRGFFYSTFIKTEKRRHDITYKRYRILKTRFFLNYISLYLLIFLTLFKGSIRYHYNLFNSENLKLFGIMSCTK
jgi:ADP-heptose:LPS heptosyltransferase